MVNRHARRSFADAVLELRHFGIEGPEVYLVDAIPLLEMMWSDGRADRVESALVAQFLRDHVDRLNGLAGAEVLTHADAGRFLARFASERPHPELLALLESLVPDVSLASSDAATNRDRRQAILDFCLQIGAACTPFSTPEARSHFERAERECFWRIVGTLEIEGEAARP